MTTPDQTFFIHALLPNLNDMISAAKARRGAWSRYTDMKLAYGVVCKHDIRAAQITPCVQPVTVRFVWHEKTTKRDPDNICAGQKFVLDALVALKILRNDGWADIIGLTHSWLVDPAHPGVAVTLIQQEPR